MEGCPTPTRPRSKVSSLTTIPLVRGLSAGAPPGFLSHPRSVSHVPACPRLVVLPPLLSPTGRPTRGSLFPRVLSRFGLTVGGG